MNFDKTQVSRILHIPQEVYERIVRNSFTPTQQDIINLETAISKDDYKTMHAIAHRLKGTYSNLRVDVLATAAKQMNEVAITGQGKEEIAGLLGNFKKEFEELKKLFEP